jgi:hypothetical protein
MHLERSGELLDGFFQVSGAQGHILALSEPQEVKARSLCPHRDVIESVVRGINPSY